MRPSLWNVTSGLRLLTNRLFIGRYDNIVGDMAYGSYAYREFDGLGERKTVVVENLVDRWA